MAHGYCAYFYDIKQEQPLNVVPSTTIIIICVDMYWKYVQFRVCSGFLFCYLLLTKLNSCEYSIKFSGNETEINYHKQTNQKKILKNKRNALRSYLFTINTFTSITVEYENEHKLMENLNIL